MSLTSSGTLRAVAKFFFEGERKFFVKGVTYGPFRPDAAGHFIGTSEQTRQDLAQIRLVGLNLVRVYRQLNNPLSALWLIVSYIIFLIFLAIRARRLKRRVAEVVDVAAHRAGLQRISRRTSRAIRRAEAARLAKVDSVNA